jgi:arsenate reductase (glutaredoxin)
MQIYHNPRCSKSRQALALCQERDVDLEVVEYLKEKPTRKGLETILSGLDGDLKQMTRAADLKKAGLEATLDLLVERPEFLQRPILVDGERVSVARSPEAVAEFLDAQNRGK